jgi:hypothetical protein
MKKIFNLFKKDMILGIKDVFVILEIVFAVLIMLMLLFVFPKNIENETMIYIYDKTGLIGDVLDRFSESGNLEIELDMFVDNREAMIEGITKNKNALGVIISYGKETPYHTEMLVQPYTTDAMMKFVETEMEDLLSMLHPPSGTYPMDVYNSVRITSLQEGLRDELPFNQRMLPPILMIMVGVMGLFAMVSLIGQERSDATIQAFRVAPTGMWGFLLSKHLMLLAVSFITFSVLYIPVMGGFQGYPASLVLILLTVIFGSTLGVILGTYIESPMSSIGVVILIMLLLSLPAISLFAPVFSPEWMKLIPSYYTLFGLDAAMFPDNNRYIIWQSIGVLCAIDLVLVVFSARVFSVRIRKEA